MRMPNETRAENVAVNRDVDDLVQILTAQNADSRIVTRCLQHLVIMLETLGESAASALVRKHLESDRPLHADRFSVLEFQD